MPNPFHYRAAIDNLWRRANSNAPAYRRLNALDAIVRELFAPTERARLNYQRYLATDPFDVARHKLRDLYDHHAPQHFEHDHDAPQLFEVAPAQAGAAHPEEETPDEDDEPL
ncbi:MAG: hypothetical protein OXT70_02920 [Chloroflexota bacterium]|nr:hypothetical protein [Chloroflexota bacterium]